LKPARSASAHTRVRQASPSLSSWLQIHRKTGRDTLQGLLKTPISSFATVFVIAVGLLLPALLYGISANITSVLENFNGSAQISLYMELGIDESVLSEVSEDLLTENAIAHIEIISSRQALEEFGAAAGLLEIGQQMADNPLPASLVITPADVDPGAVAALAARLQTNPLVELVQVDSQWLQRLAAASQLFAIISKMLTAVIALGLFFIVGNTIKLAIENRRDEIRVVKLVGGTDAFAARPFLYTGMYYGLGGGLLAAILQWFILIGFSSALQNLLQLYENSFQLQGFGFVSILALVLGGGVIGWIGALLTSFREIAAVSP
jgi:cell division transport system permease protein